MPDVLLILWGMKLFYLFWTSCDDDRNSLHPAILQSQRLIPIQMDK